MSGKISDLFPPKDLLDSVGNVESQLRQRRRLGLVGWVALLYTAAQAVVLVAGNSWLQAIQRADWTAVGRMWYVLVGLFLVILAVGFVGWYYFWLRESRQPFRFTYWIEDFEQFPRNSSVEEPRMAYLAHDLSERLAVKISRLRRHEENPTTIAGQEIAGSQAVWESQVRVRGTYELRDDEPSESQLEPPGRILRVTPWVRVGPPGSPETLAHPVTIQLPTARSADRAGSSSPTEASSLAQEDYDRLLNWLYFHVASEIYKRIRSDVERRIGLLPTPRLRVAAYLREAEDYVVSPTFDGYSDAADFYEAAILASDRTYRPYPRSTLQRAGHWMLLVLHETWSRHRTLLARWGWSRFGQPDLIAARAEIGYARATINRQILAMLSGRRQVLIGLARARAESAVNRLKALPSDERTRQALFEARTELALAWHRLDHPLRAAKELEQARAVAPLQAATDQRFLLAEALDEPDPRKARERFVRALEANLSSAEIARYLYAEAWELVWRGRLLDELDHTAARAICQEYRKVIEVNPGNLSAWTSLGYIRWLVHEVRPAEEAFQRGLEYKEIQTETYVAELDYGLARKLAEEGRFTEAYSHFARAASAVVSSEMVYGRGSTRDFQDMVPNDLEPLLGRRRLLGGLNSFMFFDFISPAILRRFQEYVARVEYFSVNPLPNDRDVQPYMREVVLGWALTDYGQACEAFFRRTGDRRWRRRAVESLRRALDLDPKQWLARYALYSFSTETFPIKSGDDSDGYDYLVELKRLVPQWVRPMLEELRTKPSESLSQEANRLLPHAWLRAGSDRNIDHRTVRRRGYRREFLWEKEFEDSHVQALELWALRYPATVKPGTPTAESKADVKAVKAEILRHVHAHFRADWAVLSNLAAIPPDQGGMLRWQPRWSRDRLDPPPTPRQELEDWLRRWFLRDPVSWERIQWMWWPYLVNRGRDHPEPSLIVPLATPDDMIEQLREVLRSTSWARPALYRWLAYAFWRLRRDAHQDGLVATQKISKQEEDRRLSRQQRARLAQKLEAARNESDARERNAATARLEAMVRSATAESEWRMAAHIDAARAVANEGDRWRWRLRPEDYWRLREVLLCEQDPSAGRPTPRRVQAGLALLALARYARGQGWYAAGSAEPPSAVMPRLGKPATMSSPVCGDTAADVPGDAAPSNVNIQFAQTLVAGLDESQVEHVRSELQRQLTERMRRIGLDGQLGLIVGGSGRRVTVPFEPPSAEHLPAAKPTDWLSSDEKPELGLVGQVLDIVDRDPLLLVGPHQVHTYYNALLKWEGRRAAPGSDPPPQLPFTEGELGAALRWLVHRGVSVRNGLSLRSLLADVRRSGRALEDALETAYSRRRSRRIWLSINPSDFPSICSAECYGAPGRLRHDVGDRLRRSMQGVWPLVIPELRVVASRDVEPGTYRVVLNDHVAVHVLRPAQCLEASLPQVLLEKSELMIGVDDVERLLGEDAQITPAKLRSVMATLALTDITRALRTFRGGAPIRVDLKDREGAWSCPNG